MCKLYTREEVIKLFEKLEKDMSRFYAEDTSTIVPLDEWVLENIPEDLEKANDFVSPTWFGEEVTYNSDYKNKNIAQSLQ